MLLTMELRGCKPQDANPATPQIAACRLRRRKNVRMGLSNSTTYNLIVDWLENYVKDMYQSSGYLEERKSCGVLWSHPFLPAVASSNSQFRRLILTIPTVIRCEKY